MLKKSVKDPNCKRKISVEDERVIMSDQKGGKKKITNFIQVEAR